MWWAQGACGSSWGSPPPSVGNVKQRILIWHSWAQGWQLELLQSRGKWCKWAQAATTKHTACGLEVQDHGAGRIDFSRGLPPWLADSHPLTESSHRISSEPMHLWCLFCVQWPLLIKAAGSLYQGPPQWVPFNFCQSLSSATQLCPTLCDAMDCSTPSLPVHHQLPEFAQTHVHQVGDAFWPSHPLLSPSPPAFHLSQHQGVFQWVSLSHQGAKILEFQLQHQSFQWIFRIDFL